MIILLFGNEPYLLDEHLREMREKFFREYDLSKLNYARLDGAGLSPDLLEREFNSTPFLAKRRMVVVTHLLSKKIAADDEKMLIKVIERMPESTIAVFVESEKPLWKAAALGKLLSKTKNVYEHNSPKGAALEAWIVATAKKRGVTLDRPLVLALAASAIHGFNFVIQEINKLAAAAQHAKATAITMREALVAVPETSAFAFVDALLSRHSKQAFQEFSVEALPLLAKQVGTMIKIKDWQERGLGQAELGSLLKIHPYVLQKNTQFARSYSLEALKQIHAGLLDIDLKLKRGAASPDVLIARFIGNFSL